MAELITNTNTKSSIFLFLEKKNCHNIKKQQSVTEMLLTYYI
jgi:hypothetical protein